MQNTLSGTQTPVHTHIHSGPLNFVKRNEMFPTWQQQKKKKNTETETSNGKGRAKKCTPVPQFFMRIKYKKHKRDKKKQAREKENKASNCEKNGEKSKKMTTAS